MIVGHETGFFDTLASTKNAHENKGNEVGSSDLPPMTSNGAAQASGLSRISVGFADFPNFVQFPLLLTLFALCLAFWLAFVSLVSNW